MTTDNKQALMTLPWAEWLARRYGADFTEKMLGEISEAVLSKLRGAGEPSGYAYRYQYAFGGGTVIRFNNGGEVNGTRPIEAIPYFFHAAPQTSAELRNAALEEAALICDTEGDEWDSDDVVAEKNYAHHSADRIRDLKSAPADDPETMEEILRRERERTTVVLPKDPTLPESPAKGAGDVELPPLPVPGEAMSKWGYDESDMQAYATAAVLADRGNHYHEIVRVLEHCRDGLPEGCFAHEEAVYAIAALSAQEKK